jgi:signal transduction histidine kinase
MDSQAVLRLASLIDSERETVLARWRAQVRQLPSAADLDTPELNDHVPVLLEEMIEALRKISGKTIAEARLEGSAPIHGLQRYRDGFDILEVVSEYNILRGCIHDAAEDAGLAVVGPPFHILNRVLDGAIGTAVQAFATQQALEVQKRREEHLAFIAHDLRTPLGAISVASKALELLSSGDPGRDDAARMLKIVRRNAGQLQILVESILKENGQIQVGAGVRVERRDFDLWPLAESLVHDLQPLAATASTTLINQVPDDLMVSGDASLVKRIFQNLVTNAIKFTPRGEVTIGAAPAAAGNGVECWVTDNGVGIDEDRCATLFERRADKDPPDGTGLGLGIVKSFVEAHGGTVSVSSTVGAGSIFRFTLPKDGHPAG